MMYQDVLCILIFYFVMGADIGSSLSHEYVSSTIIFYLIVINFLAVLTAFVCTAASFIVVLAGNELQYHTLGFCTLLGVLYNTLTWLWDNHVNVIFVGGKKVHLNRGYRRF